MSLRNTHFSRNNSRKTHESGNATIYVLIVVALFAALAFTVARQNDSSESAMLSDEQADIIVGQIISYPYQVKQAIEMMTMTGADLDALDYIQPGMSGYDDKPQTKKIFHPGGGGLSLSRIPPDAIDPAAANPSAGWYLGTFNNVEWSQTAANDMILVAWPLKQQICERINERMTGKVEVDGSNIIKIPTLGNTIPNVLIDRDNPPGTTVHSGTNVTEFNIGTCADCEDKPTLCVKDSNGRYGFYSVIISR